MQSVEVGRRVSDELVATIVDMLQKKHTHAWIRKQLKIGNRVIDHARRISGIGRRLSPIQQRAALLAKLEALPDSQWLDWKVRGTTVKQVCDELGGLSERWLSRWCRQTGRKFWNGYCGSWKKHETRAQRALADKAEKEEWRPTRQEYADLCDREFSTPPFLRKAPAMLAVIEEYEARDRKRGKRVPQ